MGWGLSALQFSWSLKNGTRTFDFRLNKSSSEILGPLGGYDHSFGKKKYKIPHFCR